MGMVGFGHRLERPFHYYVVCQGSDEHVYDPYDYLVYPNFGVEFHNVY